MYLHVETCSLRRISVLRYRWGWKLVSLNFVGLYSQWRTLCHIKKTKWRILNGNEQCAKVYAVFFFPFMYILFGSLKTGGLFLALSSASFSFLAVSGRVRINSLNARLFFFNAFNDCILYNSWFHNVIRISQKSSLFLRSKIHTARIWNTDMVEHACLTIQSNLQLYLHNSFFIIIFNQMDEYMNEQNPFHYFWSYFFNQIKESSFISQVWYKIIYRINLFIYIHLALRSQAKI